MQLEDNINDGVDLDDIIEFNERMRAMAAEQAAMAELDGDDYEQGQKVAWRAYPGSQTFFIKSKAFETLFHGTRGPGKTDALLMSFARHCEQGHGAAWRGIIVRQTYPELADIVTKSQKWFPAIFGGRARYNRQNFVWEWDSGEKLMFRHMKVEADYLKYHGHEYPFIGFEELTNWADPDLYLKLISTVRSSTPGVPLMVRATCNPSGPGHNWVRERFRLGGEWWKNQLFEADGVTRAAIYGNIRENTKLLRSSPNYLATLATAAGSPEKRKAWLVGSWDITSGGMFDDLWTPQFHVISSFDVPMHWPIRRSYDHGESRPFSVGWYTQAKETCDVVLHDGRKMRFLRGDVIRLREWYGFTGKRNQGLRMAVDKIAEGIIEREKEAGYFGRVKNNVADGQIFAKEANHNNKSIADMFAESGVHFMASEKGRGSRAAGWQEFRRYLIGAMPDERGLRNQPGLFIIGTHNPQFIETVPTLARDEKNPDDVDTNLEDHIADEVRYMIRHVSAYKAVSGQTTGDF
jgi:hypothetical protein